MDTWIRGLFLGFSIAAPVGPIGLLCIRRTLSEGRRSGFISGLGAASADAVYGAVAAFGLAAALSWLTAWQLLLHGLGAAFLFWLGLRTIFSVPPQTETHAQPSSSGLSGAYISTLFLTLSNPMTIFAFLGVFAGAGFQPSAAGPFSAFTLVAGVFCGSVLWWGLLSSAVYLLGRRLKQAWLLWINRLAGIGLLVFGLLVILKDVLHF